VRERERGERERREREARERGERLRERARARERGERVTTGYEPFDLDACWLLPGEVPEQVFTST